MSVFERAPKVDPADLLSLRLETASNINDRRFPNDVSLARSLVLLRLFRRRRRQSGRL